MIEKPHACCGEAGTRPSIRDDSGAALVEFALVLPLLLMLVFGIIEFGRGWNTKQVITDAAREGARVAVVRNGTTLNQMQLEDSVRRVIRRRLQSAALDTSITRLSITADATTGVGGLAGTPATVTINYNYPSPFGGFVLRSNNIPLRSTFVMRNE